MREILQMDNQEVLLCKFSDFDSFFASNCHKDKTTLNSYLKSIITIFVLFQKF